MTTPDIGADKSVLAILISRGASLFPVAIALDDNGRCSKVPRVKEWQKSASFDIDREERLNGAPAYGFHPETIGAIVIDLDEKGGHSGEDQLCGAVGELEQIRHPSCYVDSPNGRHLYFSRAGLPPAALYSRNGLLPGVDVRGAHAGGWLVAPGSVGWSIRRQAWTRYELEGDLASLPLMPDELVALLIRSTAPSDELPPFLSPALPDEILPAPDSDPRLAKLFEAAGGIVRTTLYFERLVAAFVPEATRLGSDFVTGDYAGSRGSSCKWSPGTGIIKDFADPGKGGDFLWWLAVHKGLGNVAAAREVLRVAGFVDPTDGPSLASVHAEAAIAVHASSAPATGEWPRTDSGNAERLVHLANGTVAYNSSQGAWYTWTGVLWQRDDSGVGVARLAKQVARQMAVDAMALSDPQKAQGLQKWGATSESEARRKAMVNLAASEPEVERTDEQFDPNPDEINCLSGIIDLRSGTVRPHDKTAYMTQACPHAASFERPDRFLSFLGDTFRGAPDILSWMHAYLGYCLTGHTSEQIFPIWWGGGQNGKSVLLSIMAGVLGPYCKHTSSDTWLQNRGNQPVRDDLAAIRGARFVWASEPDAGRSLSMSIIKQATGGDPVTCRFLYGRQFTYIPTYKAAFVTNHRPQVKSQDFGTWRRLRFVPFTYRVPEEKKIPDLAQKLLEAEGSRILGWLVSGAMEWYANGKKLPDCAEIAAATDELKKGDDPLAEFVTEKCYLGPQMNVAFDALWSAYMAWNEGKGIRQYLSRQNMRRIVQERGDILFSTMRTKTYCNGIALRAD